MAVYNVQITFTDDEESAMQAIAEKSEKTVQQILDEQADQNILGQCRQWISDEVKAELEKLSPAEALTKLKKV